MAPFIRDVADFLANFLGSASPNGPAGFQETTSEESYEHGCGAKHHGDYGQHCDEF